MPRALPAAFPAAGQKLPPATDSLPYPPIFTDKLCYFLCMDDGASKDNSASEDRIDSELRSIMEGSGGEARFREPSARERDKLAKDARAQRARDEKRLAQLRKETRKQARKADKRARKAQRKAGGRRRHRDMVWGWGAVILLGAAVLAYSRFAHSPAASAGGVNDTQVVTNGAVPPVTPVSTTPAVSPLTGSGPPSDPFQGTPADTWADGTAGIVIPAAKPAGRYSASQVGYAYETTRKLLLAAALDKQTLSGGAPTAFADLLTPQQRTEFVSHLDKIGVDNKGNTLSTRGLIISFAPDTTKLIGSVIKVHGTMTAHPATDSRGTPVLRVEVDYRIAYAVEPPREPADWMRIVAEFDGTVDFGNWAGADTAFQPWWNVGAGVAGARCGTRDGYVHPAYPTGPPESVKPSGRPIDPYSLRETPGQTCQLTTGT